MMIRLSVAIRRRTKTQYHSAARACVLECASALALLELFLGSQTILEKLRSTAALHNASDCGRSPVTENA